MKIGLLFALLTILYGFGLGAAFGAAEDSIKGSLKEDAEAVLADRYGGDEAKAKKVTDKAWVYWKRAHLHANGLGTASVALILLLSSLAVSERLKAVVAALLGLGGLGYGMYWMLAGMRAPSMGSTDAAKESLQWLAVPGSGACLIGLVFVIALTAKCSFSRNG
jgi:hypothetical protein